MSTLRVERSDEVLLVSLARPERRNALNPELIAELAEAFADVGDARAVVLAGDGESFCAGADVEWMRNSVDLSYEENVADARRLRKMLEAGDLALLRKGSTRRISAGPDGIRYLTAHRARGGLSIAAAPSA